MTSRNDLCSCGSGRKYKNCCRNVETKRKSTTGLYLLVGAILLVAAVGIVPSVLSLRDDGSSPRSSTAPRAPVAALPTPQPPGPAPAGKVWSEEHGHWHDAQPSSPIKIDMSRGAPNLAATVGQQAPSLPPGSPQPDGPVPEGKVWSAEHGHWHDMVGATPLELPPTPQRGPLAPNEVRVLGQPVALDQQQPLQLPPGSPQPAGPVPPGKVWSVEHGHWHNVEPTP